VRFAVAAALCVVGVATGTALAFGPVGKDPANNFKLGRLPVACSSAPTSGACVNGVVYWLDQARASLHQGPYKLPSDFTKLSAAKQAFILVNLDRIHYGLTPITGLTSQLNGWALAGVKNDRDPVSGDPRLGGTATWAGGLANIETAYESWVYDDGYGSNNLECTSPHAAGCWGHRHAVLWSFGPGGVLAMGAATGRDRSGTPAEAMILVKGTGTYHPTYYYTWSQAVAAGAGTNNYVVHRPPALDLALQAHGLEIVAFVSAPSSGAQCQVSEFFRRHWTHGRFSPCSSGELVLKAPSPGRYRFRLRAHGKTITRYITLHRHRG
jgi:hypothetical protein